MSNRYLFLRKFFPYKRHVYCNNIIVGLYNTIKGDQLDNSEQQIKTVFGDAKKYTDKCFSESKDNAMNNVVNDAKSYTDTKFEALDMILRQLRKKQDRRSLLV
ncbi:hypothetical protein [Bartonella sp. AS69XJJH]|uniref:hypothetical protein n=2 Tax=unclassified Bartonella TaxID=2645622 RepID=UPI0035CF46BC